MYQVKIGQGGFTWVENKNGEMMYAAECASELNRLAEQVANIKNLQDALRDCQNEVTEARQEIDELREALEAFAAEVCHRRMFGVARDNIFERVSNNQICRTALTHAGYEGVR
jgi:uncharacterized coiled-coil DUF342 family protein